MSNVVRTRLIKLGNSQGIRIPKRLLEKADLETEVELEVQQHQLVIRRPARTPRQDWDEQFRAMAEQGDDRLLDEDAANLTSWDEEEWEW